MTKTAAEIRKELKNRKAGKKNNLWYKIKPDTKVYLRIGPPWKKNGDFWKDVYFHGRYPDKVYCRKNDIDEKTGKHKKCLICARVAELKTDRSPRGKKLWSLIKQNSEGLWNVLVAQKIKRTEKGVVIVKRWEHNKFQILRLSPKWQSMMMEIFADEDYRAEDNPLGVTHSKKGRLIKANREGKGRDDTSYRFAPVDHSTPIVADKEERLKLLKTLVDLDSLVRGSSSEECEAFLEKMERRAKKLATQDKEKDEDDDNDDGEDEEEKDGKAEEEDEEEDEEEEESDSEEEDSDDDDLERKYKKMKKRLKSKKSHDEDEEDDED